MNVEAAEILDGVEPKVEAQVSPGQVDPKQSPPQDDRVSSKLEVLIRREQAALERERFAKQREQELEGKLSRISEFEGVKTNPKKALELLGLSYDDLTQSMLKDGEIPPHVEIQKLREELEQYKNGQQAEKQKELEAQKIRNQQMVDQSIAEFKAEVNQYVDDNKTRYELIAFEGASELVYDVIEEHYKRTMDDKGVGKILSKAEACDMVEMHLEKKYADSRGLAKVKALWGSLPPSVQKQVLNQAEPKPVQTGKPTPKTLTNNLTATAQLKPRLSEDQRIAQIVQSFRAQKGL